MSSSALLGAVIALAAVAAAIFIGVAITEINYPSGHPYAYGPAKVIAWGAGAGVVISVAVALLAIASRRR
jgi:hypothetical protein